MHWSHKTLLRLYDGSNSNRTTIRIFIKKDTYSYTSRQNPHIKSYTTKKIYAYLNAFTFECESPRKCRLFLQIDKTKIKNKKKQKKKDHKNSSSTSSRTSHRHHSYWPSTSKNPLESRDENARFVVAERKWTTDGPLGAVKKPTLCRAFELPLKPSSSTRDTSWRFFSIFSDRLECETWRGWRNENETKGDISIGTIDRGRLFAGRCPGGTVKGVRGGGVYLWGV